MVTIGITGGIGSGKSVVASLLQLYGIPVYYADEESKRLTATSPVIRKALIALLGEAVYTPEGLDKQRLACSIFNDPACLQQVNAIIHPEVNRHFLSWTKSLSVDYCAIESAILFESGIDRMVDVRLMVYAPVELRIARAMQRDGAMREDIMRRIKNQLSDEEKKERADYVIYNDDRRALLPQITAFLSFLR